MTSLYQRANLLTGSTLQALRPNAVQTLKSEEVEDLTAFFHSWSEHKGKIVKDKIEVEETETAKIIV